MAKNEHKMRDKIESRLRLLKRRIAMRLNRCDEMSKEKMKSDPDWLECDEILREIRDLSIKINLLEELLK